MRGQRQKFSSKFKAKVALEAVKEAQTLSELSAKHGVHANQVSKWKKTLNERAEEIFAQGSASRSDVVDGALVDRLYQQIGQLQVELTWLKKKLGT